MTRVVVTFALDPELADRIRAVDPRIEVSVLGQDLLDALRGKRRFPSELQAATPLDEIRSALGEAEVMFGFWSGAMPSLVSPDDLPGALRWVQLTSAGADRVDTDLIRAGLTFTNVSGLHATPIAEYVLTYMLMFEKGWPALARNQAAHRYDRMVMPRNLSDRTVGVVGMGAIGAECARLAKAIGCRVVAIRRSAARARPGPRRRRRRAAAARRPRRAADGERLRGAGRAADRGDARPDRRRTSCARWARAAIART